MKRHYRTIWRRYAAGERDGIAVRQDLRPLTPNGSAMMEICALTPADAFVHSTLMAQAFGKGNVVTPPALDAPPAAPEQMAGVYGAFDDGQLHAALSVIDFDVHWPGAAGGNLMMGGIAGVATFAHARGRGLVDQLLRHALLVMRERGQTVSSLYPFAWAFYRRHGWDWVGEKRTVKLPLTELKSTPEGRSVIAVPGGDAAKDALIPGYDRFAARYRGAFLSGSHKWGDKLSHSGGRTTYVYSHPPTGAYLLWRYNADNSEGEIREFVADTADGYRALLGHLHYLATQCDVARLTLPADNPLWLHLMHWRMETRIEPVFMGRVVDVAGAVEKLAPAPTTPGGTLTLRVRDEQAAWNDGVFTVTHEAGQVTCRALLGGSRDADVSLTIQGFSQAFWGTPDLALLRRAGLVEVTREDGFQLLSGLLLSAPVYTMDYF